MRDRGREAHVQMYCDSWPHNSSSDCHVTPDKAYIYMHTCMHACAAFLLYAGPQFHLHGRPGRVHAAAKHKELQQHRVDEAARNVKLPKPRLRDANVLRSVTGMGGLIREGQCPSRDPLMCGNMTTIIGMQAGAGNCGAAGTAVGVGAATAAVGP